ncbi:MAG: hypothetical protein ABSF80_13135 [Chitinispirillaceae bacterium]
MKKVLIIILVIAAVAVYTWDTYQLVRPSESVQLSVKNEKSEALSIEKLLASSQKVHFVKTNRNPFLPYHQGAVSVLTQKGGVKTNQESPTNCPKVSINGIMGDQASPLVMMTLPDGSSAAVKVGQTVGDITLKKVEKDRVLIVFQKKNFWINR